MGGSQSKGNKKCFRGRNDSAENLLHVAARENLLHNMEQLLEKNPTLDLNRQFEDGPGSVCTALHAAVARGHTQVVKMLLKAQTPSRKLDVNAFTSYTIHPQTALCLAVITGNVQMVELLLNDPNCDPNKCQRDDVLGPYSPLVFAIAARSENIALKLLRHPKIDLTPYDGLATPLIQAAASGQLRIVEELLKPCHREKYDVNRKSKTNGLSALEHAKQNYDEFASAIKICFTEEQQVAFGPEPLEEAAVKVAFLKAFDDCAEKGKAMFHAQQVNGETSYHLRQQIMHLENYPKIIKMLELCLQAERCLE